MSGLWPLALAWLSPLNSASRTAWMTVKPFFGVVLEVKRGFLVVQTVGTAPEAVSPR